MSSQYNGQLSQMLIISNTVESDSEGFVFFRGISAFRACWDLLVWTAKQSENGGVDEKLLTRFQ